MFLSIRLREVIQRMMDDPRWLILIQAGARGLSSPPLRAVSGGDTSNLASRSAGTIKNKRTLDPWRSARPLEDSSLSRVLPLISSEIGCHSLQEARGGGGLLCEENGL